MSNKSSSNSSKNICERYHKHNCTHGGKTDKMRYIPLKKILPSRKLEGTLCEVKSCSTGVISNMKKLQMSKPRKITKSDMLFESNRSVIDLCTKCGDTKSVKSGSGKSCTKCGDSKSTKSSSCKSYNSNTIERRSNDIETQVFIDQEKRKQKVCKKNKTVHEYYKNENFKPPTTKNGLKNGNLDPIMEGTEGQVTVNNSKSILETASGSEEEIGFFDPEDSKNIENIKNFRENNYFECHSAKARVSSKGSVTSLTDHKCVYRFYLNERLFPVPLNSDHKKSIRCMDCHLPIELDPNSEDSETINGTIQTKVKIGNEVQDLTIMLPVKKPLIIQEKRKIKDDKLNDVLYFGIVKLNYNGDSIFSPTLPNDSLALKYQKGYKEFVNNYKYEYERVKEDDIIII